jgi:hypothetical protein
MRIHLIWLWYYFALLRIKDKLAHLNVMNKTITLFDESYDQAIKTDKDVRGQWLPLAVTLSLRRLRKKDPLEKRRQKAKGRPRKRKSEYPERKLNMWEMWAVAKGWMQGEVGEKEEEVEERGFTCPICAMHRCVMGMIENLENSRLDHCA